MRAVKDMGGVEVGVGHQGMARYGASQKDGRSDLVKDQAQYGANVNYCPFGCNDDELDDQGYCFHLIGFSPDGRKLERNSVDGDGRIKTRAVVKKLNGRIRMVHDEKVDRHKHKLVPVVVGGTCRVYENVPRPDDYPEPENDELSDEELALIDADEGEEPEPEVVEEEPVRRARRKRPQAEQE